MSDYRTSPVSTDRMPPGIPYIIGNEAAERFSFYGMKAALAIFLANYLVEWLGEATSPRHRRRPTLPGLARAVYLTPLLGSIMADAFFGKYKTIIALSIVYCLGHLSLALMGVGGVVQFWLLGVGLILIALGPVESSLVCRPRRRSIRWKKTAPDYQNLQYLLFSINFGAVVSTLLTPWF